MADELWRERVRRLVKLDCCAVSDAMDRLGLEGVVSGMPQQSGAGRIAGRVVTVKLGVGERLSGPPRHLCATAIESAGPDEVIVVEQRTGIEAGSWGGLLSLAAKLRGIAGVVADGPVRDIDEVRGYGLPVFTHTLTALTARGRVVETGTNVPVMIGPHLVEAGDYVVADNSAVIFVRAAQIDRVLEAAEEIVAREAAMAKALRAGKSVGTVMGGDYEYMLEEKRD
jgi:4-hydroxy-4-methyl-2-oxoglutarate aldolase